MKTKRRAFPHFYGAVKSFPHIQRVQKKLFHREKFFSGGWTHEIKRISTEKTPSPFLVGASSVKGQICTFPQFFCGKVAKGVEKCPSFPSVFDSFAQNWWKMIHNDAQVEQRKQIRSLLPVSERAFVFFRPPPLSDDLRRRPPLPGVTKGQGARPSENSGGRQPQPVLREKIKENNLRNGKKSRIYRQKY